MGNDDTFQVEVAYALPDRQELVTVDVKPGMTLRQTIEQSGILDLFPGVDLATSQVGVFGKLLAEDREVQPGERVEIYRPLKADPKEVRRLRAAQGKKMKKGGGGAQPGQSVPATSPGDS
jgi:putative ubiquitin-RnfH superfamily antitoxin RatB of RatAB toxin-antitoxin module